MINAVTICICIVGNLALFELWKLYMLSAEQFYFIINQLKQQLLYDIEMIVSL